MNPWNPLSWFRPATPPVSQSSARDQAELRVEEGNLAQHEGREEQARQAYLDAIRLDPTWSVPWFNLGLEAKYAGRWTESLECNRRAVERAPDDEGAWWNIGIAATALGLWREARKAWRQCGFEFPDADGPPEACGGAQAVRITSEAHGGEEVVWGLRLDPARVRILNIPTPDSGFRYGDVVLVDGAGRGYRMFHGHEVPVLDVLARLEPSTFRTYLVWLSIGGAEAIKSLTLAADAEEGGAEHWNSSITHHCAECSDSTLSPSPKPPEPTANQMVVAALDPGHLQRIEAAWAAAMPGARFLRVELLVGGGPA